MKLKTKLLAGGIVGILLTLTMYSVLFMGKDTTGIDDNSVIWIEPLEGIIPISENFTISIYCLPIEPMKAFEFEIYFNPLVIQANYLNKGNIFNEYDTLLDFDEINKSNICIIDNENGSIIHIYDLIIGQGNVTEGGILMNITFTSISLGISELNLSNVGITNEIEYLNITYTNTFVTIISDFTMSFEYQAGWHMISMPVNRSVDKNELTIEHNNTYYTWQEAKDNNLIMGYLYGWNEVYTIESIFEAGKGYWFLALEDVTLYL